MGMGKCNSDDHYIYYCGQESLRRNGVTLIVNKRVWNVVLGCSHKNNRMISELFPRQTIQHYSNPQVCTPTTDAEETETDWFYEDIEHCLKLTPKKIRCPFDPRGLECKSRKSRDTQSNRQVRP